MTVAERAQPAAPRETMSDAAFLTALETATLDLSDFTHRAHVRAAFLILSAEPTFGRALDRMERTIRAFAAANGKDGLYHATVTVAYMAAINVRRAQHPGLGWPDFAVRNPELFERTFLQRYYPAGFLAQPDVRASFFLPPVQPKAA